MKDHVVIIADDQTVSVNGETHKIDLRFPEDLRAVRWDPKAKEGFIERRTGDSHAIKKVAKFDFGPYIAAWKAAKKRHEEQVKAAAKAREENQERLRAERLEADRLMDMQASAEEPPKKTRRSRTKKRVK